MQTSLNEQVETIRPIDISTGIEEVITQLQERSLIVDQSHQFSNANWELLKKAGLLGLTVPREFGGAGVQATEWLHVIRTLGRACPSTTLCYLMHLCATSVIVAVGSPAIKQRFLPQIAAGRLTVAYAGTERATGTNFWALESAAIKGSGGWHLKLKKDWATLADVADLFVVPTRAHAEAAPMDISLFLVERSAGVESLEAWNGTGMRGSSSGPVTVDAIVPEDHLIGEPGKANEYITTDMFNLLLASHAALYVGVGEEAFALAVERAQTRRFAHTDSTLAETSLWQSKLGQLAAEVMAAKALVHHVAETIEETNGSRQLLKEALAAKLAGCKTARHATDFAMQIFGGSGYNMGQRVEMLWRDARAGSLMRPSDEAAEILLGRLQAQQPIFA